MGKDNRMSTFHKRGLSVLAICGMAIAFAGCSPEELYRLTQEELLTESATERQIGLEEIERKAQTQYSEKGSEEAAAEGALGNFSEEGEALTDGSCRYAYRRLSDSERLWYLDMQSAISGMTDKVKLSEEGIRAGLDESSVDKIFQCLLTDHPEFFYVEGYTYTKYTRAEKTVAIEFSGSYSLDRDAVERRKAQIEDAVREIIENFPEGTDDYEKVRYVYETLILNTDYDPESEDNQNIYSVFVNRLSVCQGYAKAAQYLLNRMGVECVLVQGQVIETGEGHAWDLVNMNGFYYYLDPTWGDISYRATSHLEDNELAQISYDYFGITTEQLLLTHRIESPVEMPDCTAVRDNYYVREGALFADYDTEQMRTLIENTLRQGRADITLRCADRECYEKMKNALVDGQEIFDHISGNDVRSFAYTTNDKQLTLTFFMMTNEQ